MKEVEKILKDLGLSDKLLIRVNNMTDKLDVSSMSEISQETSDQVWISSTEQKGFASLYDAINTKLKGKTTINWVSLSSDLGWLRSELYTSGSVLEERISNEGLIELHLENFQNDLIKLLEVDGFDLINEKQTQEAI